MICNGQGRIYVPAMVYMIFIQRVFFVFYSRASVRFFLSNVFMFYKKKKPASILFNLNLFSINHNCEPHNILIYFSSVSLNNTL